MRRIIPFFIPTLLLSLVIQNFGSVLLSLFYLPMASQAFAAAPITPSGLNTQVNLAPTPPPGKVQYDITGGTRAGTNLFHSFGDFGVPTNDIANFLNTQVNGVYPSTSNILGRVTGGNVSNIFGMIQTTNFPGANLFLMNPAGFLFGPNATVSVGGIVAFTSADYLRLADGVLFNAIPNPTADALLSTAPVAAFGFLGSNPAAIAIQGSTLQVAQGQTLSLVGGNQGFTAIDPDTGNPISVPGGVTVTSGKLLALGGQINIASVASPGEVVAGTLDYAPNVNGQSFGALGSISISQQSAIDVSGNGGGTVSIRGGQFVLDSSTISANVTGPGPVINGVESIGGGIDVVVSQDATIRNGAVIETNVLGNATPDVQYGGIHINADRIEIRGIADFETGEFVFTTIQSTVAPGSTGGSSGDIELEAGSILIKDAAHLQTQVGEFGATEGGGVGNAGNIIVTANQNLDIETAIIESGSFGGASGNAGNIELKSTEGNISVTAFSTVTTQANHSDGNAGSIKVKAPQGDILLSDVTDIFNQTFQAGSLGGIEFAAKNLTLIGNSTIGGDNLSPLQPGNIALNLSGSLNLSDTSFIQTIARGPIPAADLIIAAHDIRITGGSFLSTETNSSGPGGQLHISAENIQLTAGGQIRSGSIEGPVPGGPVVPSGAGGVIIVQGLASPAKSVLIDGAGSGIFTNTEGTGAGGDINILANTVTLQNGGTLSAATTGTAPSATGGTITVDATNTVTMNSASITASSTGTADAGSINITSPNGFTMQNSTITTQAGQGAGGGNIKVTTSPEATVLLTNKSLISASVADGPGGGGNISIDPQFVIMQNSQILAQAAQGQGGTITITTNLFLPDANSIVNADSGSGVNGTVTIQSPNAPGGGEIIPLSQEPLPATSLLNQRCAALAGGEFSSFTVAGRDSLPIEPGSWLASPLYAAGVGEGQGVRGKGQEDRTQGTSLAGETLLLSLRQIAPAGFLTQAFALDWSAGCTS